MSTEKIDYKTATISGAGGATLVGLLMAFQNQGVEMIYKNQTTQNQIVVERTNANSQRIDKLETTVQNLNTKIDNGFDSIRSQLRDETAKISDIIRVSAGDRYTRTDQMANQRIIDDRFQRIEDEIKALSRAHHGK